MSTQDTFISHLVELRDRLLRAILAVIFVFLCLFYWARDLYALLAKPLLAALPAGGQMIATDVVGVFLVPVKVAFLVAFVIALPYVLYQMWAFVAPGLYAKGAWFCPWWLRARCSSSSEWPLRTSSSFP
jgi:sec-independent protein translocase protein TatC